jgi:hypothetical protein
MRTAPRNVGIIDGFVVVYFVAMMVDRVPKQGMAIR